MRKLATIREIAEIKPIPDADRIEVARIDGWEVVVSKKDNFHVGEVNIRRSYEKCIIFFDATKSHPIITTVGDIDCLFALFVKDLIKNTLKMEWT